VAGGAIQVLANHRYGEILSYSRNGNGGAGKRQAGDDTGETHIDRDFRVLNVSMLSATDTFEQQAGLPCYIFFDGYSRTLASACSINLSALAVRLHPSHFV
jgi:hypothetical protein